MKPMILERNDTCPKCNGKRCIEAYNKYSKPINFSLYIDQNKDISDIQISYLRCKRCDTEFYPKWYPDMKFPLPMMDSDYEMFLSAYKYYYNKQTLK